MAKQRGVLVTVEDVRDLGALNPYLDYRDRYRDMARTLGFEGHMAWAEAML